jgi:hypothetical protein
MLVEETLAPRPAANLLIDESGGLRCAPTAGYFLATLRVANTLRARPLLIYPAVKSLVVAMLP